LKLLILFILSLALLFQKCNDASAETIPDVNAQSYVVVDADTGRILSSRNADVKLPMASTTKIMTSILAIESIDNLNKLVQIPEYCTGVEGSSIYLKPNQQVSVLDLLYGTMLRSGNDAANALADAAEKNTSKNFIEMMNDKAHELGAYNTHFVNPNGLHDDSHYTTSYDLALISMYAMKNDVFRKIASARNYKADSMNMIFSNKNKVVFEYEYGSGIKIGYTKAAGRCLVASAKKNATEIIVVVLNDNRWFDDSYKVFDWAFQNYESCIIVDKDQFVCGSSDGKPLLAADRFSYLLTEEEKKLIRIESKETVPHMVAGSDEVYCGTYCVYLGDEMVHTGNLKTYN
jgi:D-alanyl-D-alanine carboxypeptidase